MAWRSRPTHWSIVHRFQALQVALQDSALRDHGASIDETMLYANAIGLGALGAWALADGELLAPEISSADPGSHWPHVLLMLKETAQLAAGDALTVRYAIDLAGEQPRYEFDVRRGDEALGTLRYPD